MANVLPISPAAEVRHAEPTEAEIVAHCWAATKNSDKNSWDMADDYAALRQRGWTGRRIAEEFKTNEASVSRFLACAKKFALGQTRPRFWEVYQEIKAPKAVYVGQNTGCPEWYTPPEYVEAARAVLGAIDLDPASSDVAQETVRAARHFTLEDDGLSQEWAGRVWLNPPYETGKVDRFVGKLCEHFGAGDVPAAILLTNNSTDTQWFQDAGAAASASCFPKGRIKFLDEEGNPGAPLQGQALLYFGPAPESFCETFQGFGLCLCARSR